MAQYNFFGMFNAHENFSFIVSGERQKWEKLRYENGVREDKGEGEMQTKNTKESISIAMEYRDIFRRNSISFHNYN